MFPIVKALLPIFALVLLGVLFRKWKFPGVGFWAMADRLTYFVLLPSLIINKLATTEMTGQNVGLLAVGLMLVVLIVAAVVVLIRKLLPVSNASFTSVFQGSIRPNTYVALAAALAIYGQEGLTLTAIGLAGVIPLVNILCILSFAYYIPGNPRDLLSITKNVFSNPLVIACAIGIFLNLTKIGLPFVTADIFDILSNAALPLGLISVGTGLHIKLNRSEGIPIVTSSLLKLVLLPMLAFFLIGELQFEGLPVAVAVLFASVPCAVSSYILAGHLNGDQRLMASIITIETLLAFITMPLMLILLL